MADLEVTIGANIDELKKALDAAGKSIEVIDKKRRSGGQGTKPKEKSFEQKVIDFSKQDFNSTVGIAGMIAGPIGTAVATIGMAVAGLIKGVYDLVKQYGDEARELNNMSRALGLSTGEIQKLKGISIATGVSIDALSKANARFNLNVGKATIEGGKLNMVLQKMGYSVNDVMNNKIKFLDVLKELQRAYIAGTDAQTLNYYAQQLLGDSYADFLPLIKNSSDLQKKYGDKMKENSQDEIDELERFANEWDIFWTNLTTTLRGIAGLVASLLNRTDESQEVKESRMGQAFMGQGGYGYGKTIDVEKVKQESKTQEELTAGTKLQGLGLSPAQAANTLQQMGGGDIFGAVSFSPMQAVADNTKEMKLQNERIANNTQKLVEASPAAYSPAPNQHNQ